MDFNLLQSFLEKAAAIPELHDSANSLQQLVGQQNQNQSASEGKSVLNPELKAKKDMTDIFLGRCLTDIDKKEPTLFGHKPTIKKSMLQILCKKAADRVTLLRILCKKPR